jgi:hypothetical protein
MEMTMSVETAMRQAHKTAEVYARNAVDDLCEILDIDHKKSNWREQLAPFAPVLAAMINAAATDFDTAMRGGRIAE